MLFNNFWLEIVKRAWFLLGWPGPSNKNQCFLTTFRQKLLKELGFYWFVWTNLIKTNAFYQFWEKEYCKNNAF